jgi:ATP-dependent DNA helicase RecG
MSPEELLRLIRQGENSGVEFKRDDLREQQAALFASGGLLHAELLRVSGSALADLDRVRLTDYLGRVLADEVPQDEPAWLDRLCGLGFMAERADGPPICTIAGAVLFAHRPRRLLRQAGLRWMAFSGAKCHDHRQDAGWPAIVPQPHHRRGVA